MRNINNKLFYSFFYLIFITIFLFTSCKEGVNNPSSNNVFPTTIGNTWTYKYYFDLVDKDPIYYHNESLQWGFRHWTLISKQVYNDSTIYMVQSMQEDSVHIHNSHARYDSNYSWVVTLDSIYVIKSSVTFPIVVTSSQANIRWSQILQFQHYEDLSNLGILSSAAFANTDILTISGGGDIYSHKEIYKKNVGLINLNLTISRGNSGWVLETLDLVNSSIK